MRCKKILAVFLAGFLLFGLFLPFSAAGVDVLCDAAYLIDMTTGTVILQKNESRKMYPTGLTKMVTALVAIEKADLDSVVTIDQDILDLMGDVPSSVTFRAGEKSFCTICSAA
jgi:D-alanyl-D-alanine carboxypeptidase